MRKATVASQEVLSSFGASSIESEGETQLQIRNWVFKSSHNKICTSQQLVELARHIESIVTPDHTCRFEDDNVHINGFSMRLPPMLFLQDLLSATYAPAGVELKVSASDALSSWAAQHDAAYVRQYPLVVTQVPYAKTWAERSLPGAAQGSHVSTANPSSSTEIKTTVLPKWDWTFGSDYSFSVKSPSETTILSGRRLADQLYASPGHALWYGTLGTSPLTSSGAGGSTPRWACKQAAQSGLDMALLRQSGPDAPILFYDEVLLYQDDLEDCGEVLLDARIRVMPSCWFLLARMFVRVDGVSARIKETRLFHAFGADSGLPDGSIRVHVTVTWKELDLGPSASVADHANIPPRNLTIPTNINMATPSSNAGIQHLLRKPQELSENLPVVNDKSRNF